MASVNLNLTTGLELPAVRGRRDRIASPSETAALIAALPESDQGPLATAMYAGLRPGELVALRWEDVDLKKDRITVARSWDVNVGVIEPKSQAGRRTAPIPSGLRERLIEHRLRSGRAEGLVFGRSTHRPFEPVTLAERAGRAWKKTRLEGITLGCWTNICPERSLLASLSARDVVFVASKRLIQCASGDEAVFGRFDVAEPVRIEFVDSRSGRL
jgi:integrase